MSNKNDQLNEEIGEAVEKGLKSFKESTDATRTVNPTGFDDPALYQDATGKGAMLGTLQGLDTAAQNMASIQAKPSDATGGGTSKKKKKEEVSEEEEISTLDYLSDLLDEDELSESFMEKLSTIFDTALNDRINHVSHAMQESFNDALNSQVETISEDLAEKLDEFLSYVVEEWTTENELAIERGIKSDIAESLLTGLKGLFESHYIEMPEEKVKVVEELYDVKEDLEHQLNEQLERNIQLTKAINQAAAHAIFTGLCEGLTQTEIERFYELAEGVQFEDYDQYSRKLSIIKESFIGNKSSQLEERAIPQINPVQRLQDLSESFAYTSNTDPMMEAYTQAIGFQNRNKK